MKALERISFRETANRVCALYNEEEDALLLGMMGQEYLIRRDGIFLRGQKAPEVHTAVILDYLFSPAVEPVKLPWRSLGDIAAGMTTDFRTRVELPLTHYAMEIISRANALLPMMDAQPVSSLVNSDVAISVRALPKVYLHVELSQETQDFPSEAWVLFSNNADAFLDLPNLQALAEHFKDRLLSLLRIY
ncbi:MAG TPA: DUF3786 domain-containing protein [Nitrospirota bacterium]|nr:DUF3786 domain-containing protein [Nitrospirota bacterium]